MTDMLNHLPSPTCARPPRVGGHSRSRQLRCRNFLHWSGTLEFLCAPAFKAYISTVTGSPLGEITGLQAHQMRPGHFLKPH